MWVADGRPPAAQAASAKPPGRLHCADEPGAPLKRHLHPTCAQILGLGLSDARNDARMKAPRGLRLSLSQAGLLDSKEEYEPARKLYERCLTAREASLGATTPL